MPCLSSVVSLCIWFLNNTNDSLFFTLDQKTSPFENLSVGLSNKRSGLVEAVGVMYLVQTLKTVSTFSQTNWHITPRLGSIFFSWVAVNVSSCWTSASFLNTPLILQLKGNVHVNWHVFFQSGGDEDAQQISLSATQVQVNSELWPWTLR